MTSSVSAHSHQMHKQKAWLHIGIEYDDVITIFVHNDPMANDAARFFPCAYFFNVLQFPGQMLNSSIMATQVGTTVFIFL